MATIHSVLVSLDEQVRAAIDSERLERLASAVMEREGLPPGEVSVLITDDEMVRRLNREYAGEDTPTDVLAFSLTEGEEFASPDDVLRLGEVIIAEAGYECDVFSFVPCLPGDEDGFARPEIRLPHLVNPRARMQARSTILGSTTEAARIWDATVEQVLAAGLALGTRLSL